MDAVDDPPCTIARNRVLTDLVGSGSASASDVVAEFHGPVAREPMTGNLNESPSVGYRAECHRWILYLHSVFETAFYAMLASPGTFPIERAEEQPLTLWAGAPTDLDIVRLRNTELHRIGEAARLAVLQMVGGTKSLIIGESGKVHSLALWTGGPAKLNVIPRRRIKDHRIGKAARLFVLQLVGGTNSLKGESGKVHPLAFRARGPASLNFTVTHKLLP